MEHRRRWTILIACLAAVGLVALLMIPHKGSTIEVRLGEPDLNPLPVAPRDNGVVSAHQPVGTGPVGVDTRESAAISDDGSLMTARVVSSRTGDALANASIYYSRAPTDRLETVLSSPPVGRTDDQGICALPVDGCYLFVHDGYAPKSEMIKKRASPHETVVRLFDLCMPIVRITSFGRPIADQAVVLATRRWTTADRPGALSETTVADAGRIAFGKTDPDGVIEFGPFACGQAFLSIDTEDFAFKSPSDAVIDCGGATLVDVPLLPVFIGSIRIRDFPAGWGYSNDKVFPSDVFEWGVGARGLPMECWPGRRKAVVRRIGADPAKVLASDLASLVDIPILSYASAPVGEAVQVGVTVSIDGRRSRKVDTMLVAPSKWNRSGDEVSVADLVPSNLTPMIIEFGSGSQFETPTEGKLIIDISGKAQSGAAVSLQTTFDAAKGSAIAMIPDGTYTARPLINLTNNWHVPAVFRDRRFSVGIAHPRRLSLALDLPISLVSLRAFDSFGRPVHGFTIIHKGVGRVIGSDAACFPVDEDELEYSIGGVSDAGYLPVPRTKMPLSRGILNHLDVLLEEKAE